MRQQRQIIIVQISSIVIVSIITALIYLPDLELLKGVLYGGLISLLASLIILLRVKQALNSNAQKVGYLYLGALERLLGVIVLFGVGSMWLMLNPVAMVIGLVAGQVGFAIGGYKTKD